MAIHENVLARRNWFRFFPEGTVEFNAIVRVLAVMLLATLLVVPGTQRPIVLTAIAALLWLDAVLLIWWFVQVVTDLDEIESPGTRGEPARRRFMIGLLAALPSIPAVLLIAPWAQALISRQAVRVSLLQVLVPLLLILFVVLLVIGYRRLQDLRLNAPLWTALLLVPITHWFALHRLLPTLRRRIADQTARANLPRQDFGSGATIVADVSLIASLLCWGLVLVLPSHGGVVLRLLDKTAFGGGLFFAAVFAISEIAAMEQVQRQLVWLIRKVETTE